MTSSNNINPVAANTSLSQDQNVQHSQTDAQADANKAPAQQDRTANAVFGNDQVSSRQVEGLTDTDELSKQIAENASKVDKSPENALNEQGAANQAKTEQNDGSAGNQQIREAVEHLNADKLKDNVLAQDEKGTVDISTKSGQ